MTKPKEPTLTRSERHSINFCPKHGETGNEPCAICFPIESKFESCSEVVERLHKECMPWGWADLFDREKAEAILHSWRERRVQELEKLLRFALDISDASISPVHPDRIGEWREKAKKLLANSEQIRKGAKHE